MIGALLAATISLLAQEDSPILRSQGVTLSNDWGEIKRRNPVAYFVGDDSEGLRTVLYFIDAEGNRIGSLRCPFSCRSIGFSFDRRYVATSGRPWTNTLSELRKREGRLLVLDDSGNQSFTTVPVRDPEVTWSRSNKLILFARQRQPAVAPWTIKLVPSSNEVPVAFAPLAADQLLAVDATGNRSFVGFKANSDITTVGKTTYFVGAYWLNNELALSGRFRSARNVQHIDVSPDTRLISVSESGYIACMLLYQKLERDILYGRSLPRNGHEPYECHSAGWSPNGSSIAFSFETVNSPRSTINVYDVRNRKLIRYLTAMKDARPEVWLDSERILVVSRHKGKRDMSRAILNAANGKWSPWLGPNTTASFHPLRSGGSIYY